MFDEAKIYGNIRNSHWTYYKHGKKYEIYSPLKQNEKHVDYLKSFLQDFGDIPYFSIITMICNDFKISGESIENTVICNSLPAMQRAMRKVSENRPIVFDDSKKQILYDYIKSNQHTGKEARQAHKNNFISYKESLDEMKNNKICPYCKTDLVLREGKYGKFFGCSNYPKCKFTMKLMREYLPAAVRVARASAHTEYLFFIILFWFWAQRTMQAALNSSYRSDTRKHLQTS